MNFMRKHVLLKAVLFTPFKCFNRICLIFLISYLPRSMSEKEVREKVASVGCLDNYTVQNKRPFSNLPLMGLSDTFLNLSP